MVQDKGGKEYEKNVSLPCRVGTDGQTDQRNLERGQQELKKQKRQIPATQQPVFQQQGPQDGSLGPTATPGQRGGALVEVAYVLVDGGVSPRAMSLANGHACK